MKLRHAKRESLTGKTIPVFLAFAWCVLSALTCVSVHAAFEDLGAGARGPGMGNAMVPVADDVSAAHYNPAGLGVMTRPQFTAAYTQLFSGLTDDSALGTSFFGYAHPVEEGRRGTFAGALNSLSLDGGLYSENTLYLSYGRLAYTRPRGGELFLGTTLKYLSSSFGSFVESSNATNGIARTGRADPLLSGNSSHKAFDADLGALYRFRTHYQLGLQVAHVMSPNMAFNSADSDPLPLALKLGFNYKSLISNLVAQLETKKAPDGSTDNIFTAAAERWFPKVFTGDFGVRGALGMGTREYKQLSLGLSYRNRRLQVDYGFSLPLASIADTSGSHRMAITFRFGKPTENEETLETLMEKIRDIKPAPAEEVAASSAPVSASSESYKSSGYGPVIDEKLARAEEAVKSARYREAVSLAVSIIDINPAVSEAWQTMGVAYLGMEKYQNSLQAWNNAYEYEKNPVLKEAIKGYIKSISRLEASKAASKPQNLSGARKTGLSQEEIDSMLTRGVGYYINREFEKAREIFEKVLVADPENIEAYKALRRLKDEQGK